MNVDDFIVLEFGDDVPQVAQALFERKYARAIPEFPHHVVANYVVPDSAPIPLCYVHFTDCGDILLGGGACVDDRVARRMLAEQREAIRQTGGIYQHVLRRSVVHFAPRFSAIFGFCGNALAERIDRAVGFESTQHEHLLVFWTQAVAPRLRHQMIAKAQAFTPF